MLDSVDYLTLLQYSPRGLSEKSKTSQKVKDIIKAGRFDEQWHKKIYEIIKGRENEISAFLNKDVTLVPAPRSSLIKHTDLWPSLEICKLLEPFAGRTVLPCLIRQKTIKKSSLFFNADERPSIKEQFESMVVENAVPTNNITLVDDVLTLGRTSIAGASRLSEKFPNATIRVFALIRTVGIKVADIDDILNVKVGNITYNAVSGKCTRNP